jgi:hypothetical protein
MKLAVMFTAWVSFAGIASADDFGPAGQPQIQPAPRDPARAQMRRIRREQRMLRREMRIAKLIRKYDLNHDGVVDRGEMPPRLARRLQRLDRNHDGWLDANDIAPPRGQ